MRDNAKIANFVGVHVSYYNIFCYNYRGMAKIILAVSGGVDSMVMLDVICRSGAYSPDDIIVAHFDHGIRQNSGEDAEFVRKKTTEYGVQFRLGEGKLGARTSEDSARDARYEFLYSIDPYAPIFVAHHLDDLVETVAINSLRGTGWRGLAGLNRQNIRRPFLEMDLLYEPMDKAAIIEYAAKRRLNFREDQSNSSDEYLRNRIRHEMNNSGLNFEQKMEIYRLWQKQKELKDEIDTQIVKLLPEDGVWQRSWFREMDAAIALELLRAGTLRAGAPATRPQLEDFRQAILNYAPGKYFNLPGDRLVKLNKDDFELL